MFKFLLLFTFWTLTLGIDELTNKGTFFEVIGDRFEQLEANLNYNDWSGLKVQKISRTNTTRAMFGVVIYKIPFGNEIEFEVKLFKKQGGEYRLTPYRVPRTPLCTYLATDIYVYPDFARTSDFPIDIGQKCPLPPQNYTLNGFFSDFRNFPKVMLPSGDFTAELVFYYQNEIITRFRYYATVHNIGK